MWNFYQSGVDYHIIIFVHSCNVTTSRNYIHVYLYLYGSYLSGHSAGDAPLGADVLITSSQPPYCCLHSVPINTCSLSLCKIIQYLSWRIPGKKITKKNDHMYTTNESIHLHIFWNSEVRFTVVNLKPFYLQYHSHYAWYIWQVYYNLIYLLYWTQDKISDNSY